MTTHPHAPIRWGMIGGGSDAFIGRVHRHAASLDGLSALRTIKSMHPHIEVAMVSSVSGDAQKAEEAFRLGACQVLGKPFDPEVIEALVEHVRAMIGERAASSEGGGA